MVGRKEVTKTSTLMLTNILSTQVQHSQHMPGVGKLVFVDCMQESVLVNQPSATKGFYDQNLACD